LGQTVRKDMTPIEPNGQKGFYSVDDKELGQKSNVSTVGIKPPLADFVKVRPTEPKHVPHDFT